MWVTIGPDRLCVHVAATCTVTSYCIPSTLRMLCTEFTVSSAAYTLGSEIVHKQTHFSQPCVRLWHIVTGIANSIYDCISDSTKVQTVPVRWFLCIPHFRGCVSPRGSCSCPHGNRRHAPTIDSGNEPPFPLWEGKANLPGLSLRLTSPFSGHTTMYVCVCYHHGNMSCCSITTPCLWHLRPLNLNLITICA